VNKDPEFIGARCCRAAAVQNLFKQGKISKEDAEGVLSGCLTPGNYMTKFDDRNLLDNPIKFRAMLAKWKDIMGGSN
jgi:hypothetical protein